MLSCICSSVVTLQRPPVTKAAIARLSYISTLHTALWNSLPPALHQPATSTETAKTPVLSLNQPFSFLAEDLFVFQIITP